jgi:hypothetical protein
MTETGMPRGRPASCAAGINFYGGRHVSDAVEWTKRDTSWVAQVDEETDVPQEIDLPGGVKLVASPGDEDWVGFGFEDATGHRWMLSCLAADDGHSEWVVEPSQDSTD